MQPKIIKLDKRYITGMFGNIETQGELWVKVNEGYTKNPFKWRKRLRVLHGSVVSA